MIDDGFFKRFPKPHVVLEQHVMVGPSGVLSSRPRVITSAGDSLQIRMFGRGAHGSMPQASIDPVVMAAATVLRLQTIVSREIAAKDAAVVTIGSLQADAKENVIPDEAIIKQSRQYEFRLPDDWPPQSVPLNGAPIVYAATGGESGWRYDGNTPTTIIRIHTTAINTPVTLRVHRAERLMKKRADLDRFSGVLARLRHTSQVIDGTVPLTWRPDALLDAMQSGDRISYPPNTIVQEIAKSLSKLQAANASVRALEDRAKIARTQIKNEKAKYYPQPIVETHQKQFVAQQIENYKHAYSQMTAMMQDASNDVTAH